MKTHSANWKSGVNSFTNTSNTHGIIHIVRDPRNVITSLKNHFNKDEYEELLSFMVNEKKFIGTKEVEKEFEIPTLISSWSNHFKSWKKLSKNYLLIKYENLLKDNEDEFYKIVKFIESNTKTKFTNEQVKETITVVSLKILKNKKISLVLKRLQIQNQKFFFMVKKLEKYN